MEFLLDDGSAVLIRVSEGQAPGSVLTRSASATVIEKAETTFDSVMHAVRGVARSVAVQIEDLVERPDVLVVEFGVELSAQAGAIISAAGASAQLKVSLTWNK